MIGKSIILSVSIMAILVMSSVSVAFSVQAPEAQQPNQPAQAPQQIQLEREQKNWEFVSGNSLAWGYSPQTLLTKNNVQALELKWLFPIPPIAAAGRAVEVGPAVWTAPPGAIPDVNEGSITPPLIVDGIVYIATSYFRVIALDAGTGKLLWSYQITANITEARKSLPLGGGAGHIHAINYVNGWIIIPGLQCNVIALDALSGKVAWTLERTCADIPGNAGLYTSGLMSYPPPIYKKGNTLIYVPGVVDGYTGRGFVAGYDLNAIVAAKQYDGPPKWRFFTVPPAGGDPAWGDFLVSNCKKIWIQGVSSCEIDQKILRNDWGDMELMDFKDLFGKVQKVTKSGTGTVWGQMSVDEDTGIVYMSTSQPTIDWNATYRPGPNLFSNTILAINANNGQLVWAHQSLAHDIWDWDCSWNTVLGKIGDRKVVFKNCKIGILFALDAATGELIWYFYPPDIKRNEWTPMHENSKLGGGNLGPKERSLIGGWDPRNPNTLTLPWPNYPSKEPFWQSGTAGSTDIAYDGKTIYTRAINTWSYWKAGPAEVGRGSGRVGLPAPEPRPSNTTLYAVDAATGKMKWSAFFEGPHRTGPIVSGGIVYFSHSDGNIYALDSDTGKTLWSKYFGTGINIPPTVGATADGKVRLFQMIGGGATSLGTPGALVAFGLPDKLPEPQVITKEVVKEVPKEVVKEVVKEVPKEVVSPISYAALGVGVILVVIAGIMMSRRKKV